MGLFDWSTTAGSNGSIDGINIAENCAPGGVNDALRALMANMRGAFATSLKNFLAGTSPLAIANGGTGGTTAAAARAALGAASASDLAGAVPSGAVSYFAMTTAPAGWLICNGAAVSRTTYANLFSAIGITFGAGDGSTTFNLPELRGEFLRAWDGGRGVDASRTIGSAQADALKAHTHALSLNTRAGNFATTNPSPGWGGDDAQLGPFTATTASTGDAETRPRNVALLACVKS